MFGLISIIDYGFEENNNKGPKFLFAIYVDGRKSDRKTVLAI